MVVSELSACTLNTMPLPPFYIASRSNVIQLKRLLRIRGLM
jgi:hypothetical protein